MEVGPYRDFNQKCIIPQLLSCLPNYTTLEYYVPRASPRAFVLQSNYLFIDLQYHSSDTYYCRLRRFRDHVCSFTEMFRIVKVKASLNFGRVLFQLLMALKFWIQIHVSTAACPFVASLKNFVVVVTFYLFAVCY